MPRGDPFKGHRFLKDAILMAADWSCRSRLFSQDVSAGERPVVLSLACGRSACPAHRLPVNGAARAFTGRARTTVRLCQPLRIIQDQAHNSGKVIGEWTAGCGPDDAIRPVTREHEINRIEGDHAVPKHRHPTDARTAEPIDGKAVLKGVGTFRAIRRADFETCEIGVLTEIRCVGSLFEDGKRAAG